MKVLLGGSGAGVTCAAFAAMLFFSAGQGADPGKAKSPAGPVHVKIYDIPSTSGTACIGRSGSGPAPTARTTAMTGWIRSLGMTPSTCRRGNLTSRRSRFSTCS